MLTILQASAHISIQDLGRQRVAHLGVASGGAVDKQALTLANRLLRNPDNCAVLEFTAGEIQIQFEEDTWIALCGAAFEAKIESRPLWNGWRAKINKGERLAIRGPKTGMYGYLAILGGINCDCVLGGKGTDLTAQFGGFEGRYLQVDDKLELDPAETMLYKPIGAVPRANDGILRALAGPELNQFDNPSKKRFWDNQWRLSNQSNRIGARLEGEALATESQLSLRSHGVMPGAVQVPPNGQPIILLADAQTTGGYPIIACIIEADLWKVAQCRPGQTVTFQHISPNQAESANFEWQQYFYRLSRAIDAS
ncbi:biotin-dependent carboxyltransferase family protein [Shewanella sp. Isolate11]|uniref:5-oxoprolinase subunit C family protein n=1 Tax=Shewanella sp. Isolate11 TaxID=2908530 RepID=UPI001EFD193C|nr:biotin-dependent carboxyltransferase family protein [Shewanella sp. Isolate11]MCG9698123.1 biotin-dependent carboxyltransferase family protein [Shewanella sp. Isolate11]